MGGLVPTTSGSTQALTSFYPRIPFSPSVRQLNSNTDVSHVTPLAKTQPQRPPRIVQPCINHCCAALSKSSPSGRGVEVVNLVAWGLRWWWVVGEVLNEGG